MLKIELDNWFALLTSKIQRIASQQDLQLFHEVNLT